MDDRTTGESPHELLLALAGRIDDDLLAWCRELVAVGEDGRALELITATLVADRTALPAPVRAAVVAAARAEFDADTALAAAVTEFGTEHRFGSAGSDVLAVAVGALSARQVEGCRTWVTSRLTPAGAAPGPLPQPVVLVEVGADDTRPADVLAYQVAIACARAGVAAAVEVLVAGVVPPEYQQAALLTARPVHDGAQPAPQAPPVPAAEPPAWPPASGSIVMPPAARPAVPEAVPLPQAVPVPQAVPLPQAVRAQEPLPAPEPTPHPDETDASERTEPDRVPAPVTPLRGLPAAAERAEPTRRPPGDQPPPAPLHPDPPRPGPGRLPRPAAGPSPVPIGSRNGRAPAVDRPAAGNGERAAVRSLPVASQAPPDTPALASLGDPLSGPVESAPSRPATIDEDDPLGLGRLELPPEDRAPATPDSDAWLVDWITGDWAMPPEGSPDATPAPTPPSTPPAPGPAAGTGRVEIDRVDPPPPRPGRRRAVPPESPAAAPPRPSAMEQTGFILRPESVARLSDSDRELLARLQAELGEPVRPRVSRRAGIAGSDARDDGAPHTNGHGPPPDAAG